MFGAFLKYYLDLVILLVYWVVHKAPYFVSDPNAQYGGFPTSQYVFHFHSVTKT